MELSKKNKTESMWMSKDGYQYPVFNLSGKLKSGYYNTLQTIMGTAFSEFELPSDEVLVLPDSPISFVGEQIKKFWDGREDYRKFNFLQKRGILFYGPPGCGKTSILNAITQEHIKNDGVVIKALGNDPQYLAPGVKSLRAVEPERPVIILLEDFETMLESANNSNTAYNEQRLLALLDGNDQIDNVLVLATTNKPDVIADRFIKRPGRFDLVIGLNEPTANDRCSYIRKIVNGHITNNQLSELISKTEGFSLAHLREIVSCYLVLGIPVEESAERLKVNKETNFSRMKSTTKSYTIGF